MSKKVSDSELQTLTLSPTNTNEDETVIFMPPVNRETSFPNSSTPGKQAQLSTPSATSHSKGSQYERKIDLTRISRDRPSLGQKKEGFHHLSKHRVVPSRHSKQVKTQTRFGSKRVVERPTPHHTFLTDVADVRQIEQGLLQLLEDFQAGNLRAFGKDCRLRQMEAIREQQENLAKLHFDVGAEQDLFQPLSEDGLRTSQDNMHMLMEKLAQLSESIERLHTNTSSDRKISNGERRCVTNHTAIPPTATHHANNRGSESS
ncbi:uncharacterized protein LOC143021959 isoform X2 [Oratosquilla oratoria]|uniref:uncharacterized protein LOC143021959 isoform X2 n=1 Tax=Oratosquilla oratoria TaxID=337810 RepID=UPI003F77369E